MTFRTDLKCQNSSERKLDNDVMNMQINVTSPAATSFIYFLIGENYFYVLYLFYLFVFFTSSKILFLNKNCLVTVHFLFFVLSDPSIYWCINKICFVFYARRE